MNMRTRCAFGILMIFEAVIQLADSSKVKYSYFTVGHTVLLKCTDGTFNLNSAVWAGPAQNSIRKGAPVSVIDAEGKRSKWNVSQYTDDGRVLNSLLHQTRLTITGNYDLQIVNTSTLDECLYMCYLGPIEVFSRIILQMKNRPVVSSMHDGIQEIIKGTSHTLCCYVDSNPLPASTRWMNGSREILVTHNVTETCFILRNVSQYHQGNYTCIAYNIVGNGSVTIVIRVKSNTSSVKKSLLFPGIIILVIMKTITVLGPGIGLFVRYKKQIHKKTTVPTNKVQKPEGSENESADHTAITEGDNLHSTSQENDNPIIPTVKRIVVGNKVTAMVSTENTSASLDNGRNVSENYDDEYERPYNT